MYRTSLIIGYCLTVHIAASGEVRQLIASKSASEWPDLQAVNVIDERIFAKLRELKIAPSPLATDAEFLRRLTLTTIGQLPTPDEVRSFVADERADKRARKIDELLTHELHAAVWATRFSEMTGNSMESLEGPDELKPKRAKMWQDWLRKRFKENVPYDQIVRGILTATSRGNGNVEDWIDEEAALIHSARNGFDAPYADRPGLDLFWRRDAGEKPYPVEEIAERVASSFMGVRINCAPCHKHPFDRWTQQDYGGFVNLFAPVRFDMSPELRAKLADRLDQRRLRTAEGQDVGPPLPRLREVYLAIHPRNARERETLEPLSPKLLGGPRLADLHGSQEEYKINTRDRRAALMDWLVDPQNPFFARNIVNRVWAHHFGRGLVEPLDGFSVSNPPSNPELLDELAAEFVDHGYDVQRLERLILNSATWQLSSEPNATNLNDHGHFARAYIRIPSAETIVDMWHSATGAPADFGDGVPNDIHAVEIGPSRLDDKRWDHFLKLFGRSARTQTCDCEPRPGPSIRQTLSLMSDPNLLGDLSEGRLKALLHAEVSDNDLLDELFLSTLSRWPTDDERTTVNRGILAAADRRQAFEDVLWGLINTQEFITNH